MPFSTAAPADRCQLAQEWSLVGLCPLPGDEVFHSVFSLSLCFSLCSFSTLCPPSHTLTVNGSTDVGGKMMGGDKEGERERVRRKRRRRSEGRQLDFPRGLRKMSPVEEWSPSNKVNASKKKKKERKEKVYASRSHFYLLFSYKNK